jgi:hypothetical protein
MPSAAHGIAQGGEILNCRQWTAGMHQFRGAAAQVED